MQENIVSDSTMENLPELLQSCDYVCNVLPSTPHTRGLLSGDILQHCMKRVSVYMKLKSVRCSLGEQLALSEIENISDLFKEI